MTRTPTPKHAASAASLLAITLIIGGCAAPPASIPTETSSTTRIGPAPAPTEETAHARTGPEYATWTVFNVVDGDTIDVRAADGATERVRITGIDTPERGECGFGPATSAMKELVLDRTVTLVAGARDDRDRYGRIIRYVDVDGTDAGLELIRAGLAISRYDSRDGYGRHERQDTYIAADQDAEHVCGAKNPTETPVTAAPAPTPGGLPIVTFPNCAELNQTYPGGVARTDVTGDMRAGTLMAFGKTPVFDDALYEANKTRDGDNDGIACEQR